MQNKVLNEVSIEQMDDLIKAIKGGSASFDEDGSLPELEDGEVTDPLMAVGNDGRAKKLSVKTLFGKHNIRGSGNIDLYKHIITFSDIDAYIINCWLIIYSSDQLKCDSLTDLKTLLGNTFSCGLNGLMQTGPESYYIIYGLDYSDGILYTNLTNKLNIEWSKLTITDTVTTV